MRRSDSFALFDKGEVSLLNKKKIYPQWFLILPLALYIIFFLLPSIMGVAYSFTDWNSRSVLNGIHFVGIDNFKEIFTSNKDYLSGIGNTLKFTIISNIVKLIPALLIAIMLQEGRKGSLQNTFVSAVYPSFCYHWSCIQVHSQL